MAWTGFEDIEISGSFSCAKSTRFVCERVWKNSLGSSYSFSISLVVGFVTNSFTDFDISLFSPFFRPRLQAEFLGFTLSFIGQVVGDWHLKAESA